MSRLPGPGDVPGLADLRIRRLAREAHLRRFDPPVPARDRDVLTALYLLQNAAVAPTVIGADDAVRAAVRILRGRTR